MEASAPTTARRGLMKRLFDRVMVLSAGPHALWLLAAVSFAEASFFPIPPDPILAAIVLARRGEIEQYPAGGEAGADEDLDD